MPVLNNQQLIWVHRAITNRRNVKSSNSFPVDHHEREILDESEIDRLLDAAKKGRHGIRDNLLLHMMYYHSLRVSEVIALSSGVMSSASRQKTSILISS